MSQQQDLPESFYIFVNRLHPMTNHNLTVTKRFISASMAAIDIDKTFLEKYLNGTATYGVFEPSNPDCKAMSPYSLSAINNYWVEYDAEQCRRAYYGTYPSRLSAIYAFGDIETCHEVNRKYGWNLDGLKKFRLIENPLTRVIKVNMEIVSLARYAYSVSSMQNKDALWRSYWGGCGAIEIELPGPNAERQVCNSGLIWEYLIEGVVELIEK